MFVAVQDSCTYAGTKLCLNDHYLCETFCLGWTMHHCNTGSLKKWHREKRHRKKWHSKNGKGPPKKTKGRPRARMTSPSDTVFAAMFLRARMTSPSDGSPNRVVAAMFLRARMTSPSDGGPNTVFAAPFYFGYIYHENTFCQSVPATVVSCSQHGGHH